MDRNTLILAIVILLTATFILVLPRTKGCLPGLLRSLMLIVGAVAPIALSWRQPTGSVVVVIIAVLAAIIPNVAATGLASLGWQTLLRREHGVEEGLGVLDPDNYVLTSGATSSGSGSNSLDDLLFFLALLLIGGLFVVGLLLAGVVEHYLLPAPDAPGKRLARVILSFVYAIPIYVGVLFALNLIFPLPR
jgi:hypothetical protein